MTRRRHLLRILAALACTSALAAPACTNPVAPPASSLDHPGPTALVCLRKGEARPLRDCGADGEGYRAYVLQRFRSILMIADVSTRELLDQSDFVPGATGIQLPEEALDLVGAPGGTALFVSTSPAGLLRISVPGHQITSFDLPSTLSRLRAVVDDRGPALLLLDLGGEGLWRWGLDAGDRPDGAAPESLAPLPEPFGDVAMDRNHLVGVSRDGLRLWLRPHGGAWATVPLAPECSDGLDDDGDGRVDGQDPDCADARDTSEAAADPAWACANGTDDDGDGLTDLDDPGCSRAADGTEWSDATPCTDGFDNDGDGVTDGPGDCPDDRLAFETSTCADGIDNDGDGLSDGEDPSCSPPDGREPPHPAPCANGLDDNGDGLADLLFDPICRVEESLAEAAPACSNGLDDDDDGLTDLEDTRCYGPEDRNEASASTAGRVVLVLHPARPVAYVLRPVQRDLIAVDLVTRQKIRAHAGHALWDRQQIAETPLGALPLGLVIAEVPGDAEGDPPRLRGYLATRDGLILRYDPERDRLDPGEVEGRSACGADTDCPEDRRCYRTPAEAVLDLDDGTCRLRCRTSDDCDGDERCADAPGSEAEQPTGVCVPAANVGRPSAAVAGEGVDIRFGLPREIPHLGSVQTDVDRRSFSGIQLLAPDADIPSERWTLSSGAVLPGTERSAGRIVESGRTFHDPGARYCSAGVEPGDWLEILPGAPIRCGGLVGEAFRVRITSLTGDTLTLDPTSLRIRPAADADGSSDPPPFAAAPEGAALGPQCLAAPLRYQVRVDPEVFLARGSRSGVIHPWTEGPAGCVRTTDDPSWTARARVGRIIDVEARPPTGCPILPDDPAVELFPFQNPVFRLQIVPACRRTSFEIRYPETPEDVVYTFDIRAPVSGERVLQGVSGGALVAPPVGGPVVFTDEGSEALFFIDPATGVPSARVF